MLLYYIKYKIIPNIFLFISGLGYMLLYVVHYTYIYRVSIGGRETRYYMDCVARVIWIYFRSIRIPLYRKRY